MCLESLESSSEDAPSDRCSRLWRSWGCELNYWLHVPGGVVLGGYEYRQTARVLTPRYSGDLKTYLGFAHRLGFPHRRDVDDDGEGMFGDSQDIDDE